MRILRISQNRMFVDLSKRFQVKPGALYTESAYMEEARRSGEEYEQRAGKKNRFGVLSRLPWHSRIADRETDSVRFQDWVDCTYELCRNFTRLSEPCEFSISRAGTR